MGVEIVEHDSEPLVRILFDHRVQEGQEILAGAPFTHVNDDSSGAKSKLANSVRVPCRTYSLVQLRGSVARSGKHRLSSIKGLDTGLLVDAEHHDIIWRFHIKRHDL